MFSLEGVNASISPVSSTIDGSQHRVERSPGALTFGTTVTTAKNFPSTEKRLLKSHFVERISSRWKPASHSVRGTGSASNTANLRPKPTEAEDVLGIETNWDPQSEPPFDAQSGLHVIYLVEKWANDSSVTGSRSELSQPLKPVLVVLANVQSGLCSMASSHVCSNCPRHM